MRLGVREGRFFFEDLPFARKDEAKNLGAYWSKPIRTWVAPANLITAIGLLSNPRSGDDLSEVEEWIQELSKVRSFESPRPMKNAPMPHQKDGHDLVLSKKRNAFWWGLGVGKTFGALWVAQTVFLLSGIYRVFVFCPVSLISTWAEEEMRKHLNVPFATFDLSGTPKKRLKMLRAWEEAKPGKIAFALASWDIAAKLVDEIQIYPEYVIGDETSMIKNHSAKRTKASIAIADHAEYVLALNGTPYTSSVLDLWSQMRFVGEKYAGNSFWRFANRFVEFDNSPWHRPIGIRAERKDELRSVMDVVGMTVRKEDVLKDLPPYTHQVRWVEPSGAQAKALREAVDQFYFAVEAVRSGRPTQEMVLIKNAMARASKIQQIAMGWTKNEAGQVIRFPESPKIDALLDLAEETQGRKTVVFSWFVEDLELAFEALARAGAKPVLYHGQMSRARAEENKKLFREGSADFFVAQVRKSGVGLNLQMADTCVYLTNWWSYGIRVQSVGRLHRKGQIRNVFGVDIGLRGSMDEKIYQAFEEGRSLTEHLFGRRIAEYEEEERE